MNAGTRRFQALGRLKPGTMNKTEARYSAHLTERLALGVIQWFGFEVVTLKLAPDTRLTPDFAVLDIAGYLQFHDVKPKPALIADDAKVKMKVAAAAFPARFFYVFPEKGGTWDIKEVGA